ncbi:MAG: AI-2E family transporter [Alphaproteobacteria bacterium]
MTAELDKMGGRVVDVAVRLAALGLLGAWCFALLRPFIAIVVWAAILAVALWPIYLWLKRALAGRGHLAAGVITLAGLALMLGPVALLLANLAASAESLLGAVSRGTLEVPPPSAEVAGWPWIGPPLAEVWTEASQNLEAVLERFTPQLRRLANALLQIAASAGVTLVQFVAAMLLAGVLLPNAAAIRPGLARFVDRLTPARGKGFVDLAGATVRNVARGVVGVAVLQGLLLGVGFLAAGIPFAGLWTLLAVVLAIVQVGPAVVVLGTLAYAWTTLEATTALLFTLWIVPATLLDNVLRPIVMAHGLPVPMVVILAGVVGGTLVHGLVSIFVGPVVLALGWELLRAWVRAAPEAT